MRGMIEVTLPEDQWHEIIFLCDCFLNERYPTSEQFDAINALKEAVT